MQKTIGTIFALALSLIAVQGASAQETAGQILAKLNKLAPEARTKALINGAKAEGDLVVYSSMRQDQLSPFTQLFRKRYPFLKVTAFRVSGQRQATKVGTEFRAGRHQVDVLSALSATAYQEKKQGIIDPYFSPERKFFPKAYVDREGYFTPLYVVPIVLGYNIGQVKRNEVPQSYEDLLDPQWKRKMLLDTDDFEWFAGLLSHFGREKGLAYMKKLAQQDLSMRRGRTLQTQLVIAGERPVGIALHGHSVLDFEEKGAPISWAILDPYMAKPNVIMLVRHAPHPHAAALYIDWALSQEGQTKITTFGRVAVRKGIQQRFPGLVKKSFTLVDPDMIGPVIGSVTKQHRQVFVGQ